MSRRMSFSATIEQMHLGRKTVTRRDASTWTNLQPGDRLTAIEKGMGLAKGEKQVVIDQIEILSNEIVPLIDGLTQVHDARIDLEQDTAKVRRLEQLI